MDAAPPAAVVCDDRAVVRHVLTSLLARHGFAVTAARDASGLQQATRDVLPAVAVIGLPVAGAVGMEAVRRVLAVSRSCSVLVLSPFATLDMTALEAGAVALLDEDDLLGLEAALRSAFPAVPPPRPSRDPDPQPAWEASTPASAVSATGSGRLNTKPSR